MKLKTLTPLTPILLLLQALAAEPVAPPAAPDPNGAPPFNPEMARRYGLAHESNSRYGGRSLAPRYPGLPTAPTVPGGFVSSADRLSQLSADDAGPRLDFEFASVPLAAVVKEAQDAYFKRSKHNLSVIVPEAHSDFYHNTTVSMKVKQVTIGQFFELLEKASLRPLSGNTAVESTGIDPTTGMPLPPTLPRYVGYGFRLMNTDMDNPIWMFFNDLPTPDDVSRSSAGPATACRFFNLTPYLGELKVEDITTVIRAGWEMMGNPSAAKFRFHKETGMLVVAGPERELALIDQVLAELRHGSVSRPSEASGLRPRADAGKN